MGACVLGDLGRSVKLLVALVAVATTCATAAVPSAQALEIKTSMLHVKASAPILGNVTGGAQTLLGGLVGATTQSLCDVSDNETICKLNVLSYGVATDYVKPDQQHVVKVTGGVINVPTLVDATGDGFPDVSVLIQALETSNIKMTITRLLTAPAVFPVSVEALVNDPSTAGRVINVGYDGRASKAPSKWTAQAALTSGTTTTLDATMTFEGAPASLAVTGGLYTQGPGGERLNPKQAHLTFTPVPNTAKLNLKVSKPETVGTVSTSTPTKADLKLLLKNGGTGHYVDGTLDKLNAPVSVLVDKLDAEGQQTDGLSGDSHVRLSTAKDIAKANVVHETIQDELVRQRVRLATGQLPAQTDFRQTADGFVADTSDPIDVAGGVALTDVPLALPLQAPVEDPDPSYVHRDTKGVVVTTAFRVKGVRHVDVATTGEEEDQRIEIGARLAPAPLRVLVTDGFQPDDTRYEATIENMPHNLFVAIAPGQKRIVDFCGSSNDAPDPCSDEGQAAAQGIDSITIADSYAPKPLFGGATHINGKLEGIPSTLGVDLETHAPEPGDPDPHTKVHIDTTRAIGETVLRAHDGSPLPADPDQNGIVYHDTPEKYVVVAKVTGFRRAHLDVKPQLALALELRAAGGHDFTFDVDLKDGTHAVGGLPNRPARTAVSLTTPEDAPTVLAISGANAVGALQGTPKLLLDLTRPKIFGRVTKLAADVTDIPPTVDLTVDTHVPKPDDPDQNTKVHIDADHAIGQVILRASDGQPFPAAQPDNGVVYRDTEEEYAIVAKVDGFTRAHLDTKPDLALDLRAAGGHDFVADIVMKGYDIHAELPDRPATTIASLHTGDGEQTVLTVKGKLAAGLPQPTPRVILDLQQDKKIFGRAKRLVADVKALPADLTLTIDTLTEVPDDTKVFIDASGRIGSIDLRAVEAGPLPDLPGDNGLIYRDLPAEYSVSAHVDGFLSAHLRTKPDIDVDLQAAGGHDFDVDVQLEGRTITAQLPDRPAGTHATFVTPGEQPGRLTVLGTDSDGDPQATPKVTFTLDQTTPIFQRAKHLAAVAEGIPADLQLTIETQAPNSEDTRIALIANAPIGHVSFRATEDEGPIGPTDNGVIYHGRADEPYAIVAKFDEFSSAVVQNLVTFVGTSVDLHLKAAGGHDFSYDVHLNPEDGPGKTLDGRVDNRPTRTKVVFSKFFNGGLLAQVYGFDADEQPAGADFMSLNVHGLSDDPAKKLHYALVELTDVPAQLSLTKAADAKDSGLGVTVTTAGTGDIGLAAMRMGNRALPADFPALPQDGGGALVLNDKDPDQDPDTTAVDFAAYARVREFRTVDLATKPDIDATIDVGVPQDFLLYIDTGMGKTNKEDKGCDPKWDSAEHTDAHRQTHRVFVDELQPQTHFSFHGGNTDGDICEPERLIEYSASGNADSIRYDTTAGDLAHMTAIIGRRGDSPLRVPLKFSACQASNATCFERIGQSYDCGFDYCRTSNAQNTVYFESYDEKTRIEVNVCLMNKDPQDYDTCEQDTNNKGIFTKLYASHLDLGYRYGTIADPPAGSGFVLVNSQRHGEGGEGHIGENRGVNGYIRYRNRFRALKYLNVHFGYDGEHPWAPTANGSFDNAYSRVVAAVAQPTQGEANCINTTAGDFSNEYNTFVHAILHDNPDALGNNVTEAIC